MRKAAAAFSQFPHFIMKIRTILMLGWLLGLVAATGQEEKDPDGVPVMKDDLALFTQEGEAGRDPIVRLRLETWEAPALEVAKRLDDVKNADDLAKLRAECLTGPAGVSLVLSSAINISSPSKVIAESVTERMYPTEYEPPTLPCAPLEPEREKKPPATFGEWIGDMASHAVPTSFETRNTGTTLEAEVTRVFGEKTTWEVKIAVDDVRYLGKDSFGPDSLMITMPVFSSFRSTTSLRLKEGQWQLLSVMEPPRGLDSKPSDKRWVTLVRLDLQE
jgi:hypothetical protein